jgi:hypothetical protein
LLASLAVQSKDVTLVNEVPNVIVKFPPLFSVPLPWMNFTPLCGVVPVLVYTDAEDALPLTQFTAPVSSFVQSCLLVESVYTATLPAAGVDGLATLVHVVAPPTAAPAAMLFAVLAVVAVVALTAVVAVAALPEVLTLIVAGNETVTTPVLPLTVT